MPGAKLPILTITNKQYYRDDGLYIYSSADGQLDIIADTTFKATAPTCELEGSSGITLDGDVTIDGSHTFTFGTGDITLGGNPTLSAGKYLTFSNDGVSASGLVGTQLWSGGSADTNAHMTGATGWLRVKIGSCNGYIPVRSGTMVKGPTS